MEQSPVPRPFASRTVATRTPASRIPRGLGLAGLSLAALLYAASCDRGGHPSQTGKLAPDFTVSDGATTLHLADYRGKVVVLNFWASWCPPCIEETPSLLALHHQMPNLAMLAVSIDEDDQAYRDFLKQYHVDLITVRDPNQTVAQKYGTDQWPETYIIDRRGYLRRRFVGAVDWSTPEIRRFLAGL